MIEQKIGFSNKFEKGLQINNVCRFRRAIKRQKKASSRNIEQQRKNKTIVLSRNYHTIHILQQCLLDIRRWRSTARRCCIILYWRRRFSRLYFFFFFCLGIRYRKNSLRSNWWLYARRFHTIIILIYMCTRYFAIFWYYTNTVIIAHTRITCVLHN